MLNHLDGGRGVRYVALGTGALKNRATDLVALAGDRYKSHRALCNRFEREQAVIVEPYQIRDRPGCRALFRDWSKQKRAQSLEEFGRMVLADAEPAHEVLWSHASEIGRAHV